MTEYGNLTGAPIKFPWTEQQRYQNYKESYFYAIKWNSTTINKTIFISNQKLNLENCTTSTIFLNIHLLLLLYHTTSSYYLLQFKSPSSMHPRDSLATQSDFAKKKKPTCSISLQTDIPNFSNNYEVMYILYPCHHNPRFGYFLPRFSLRFILMSGYIYYRQCMYYTRKFFNFWV